MTHNELLRELYDSVDTSPFGPPCEAGVYFVCAWNWRVPGAKEKVLYVGSSKNINKRVLTPKHPYRLLYNRLGGTDTLVYTKSIETEDYIELEKAFIKYFKPRLNKQNKW